MEEVQDESSSTQEVINSTNFGFASTERRTESISSLDTGQLNDLCISEENFKEDVKWKVIEFLKITTGYDVMQDRNNIVYTCKIDFADTDCCPLWDSENAKHVGILTSTDVVRAMSFQSEQNPDYIEIEKKNLTEYKNLQHYLSKEHMPTTLITIYPEQPLLDLIKSMIDRHVHRIPLIDPVDHTVVGILSQLDILTYLIQNSNLDLEILFNSSIESIGIGVYRDIFTVKKTDVMSTVFNTMTTNQLNAVPVVSEDGIIEDVFTNKDIFLVYKTWRDSILNYNTKLETILIHLSKIPGKNKFKLFKTSDTLCTVLKLFVKEQVNQLICINEYTQPLGIISLTDILKYFLN